jgi:hypothetical protein
VHGVKPLAAHRLEHRRPLGELAAHDVFGDAIGTALVLAANHRGGNVEHDRHTRHAVAGGEVAPRGAPRRIGAQ